MGTEVKPLTKKELRDIKRKKKWQQPSHFADTLAALFVFILLIFFAAGFFYLKYLKGG